MTGNLAQGFINTFVDAGMRTATGRTGSLPQCQCRDRKRPLLRASMSALWWTPNWAAGKLETRERCHKTDWLQQVRQLLKARMQQWRSQAPKVTLKCFSVPINYFRTIKQCHWWIRNLVTAHHENIYSHTAPPVVVRNKLSFLGGELCCDKDIGGKDFNSRQHQGLI